MPSPLAPDPIRVQPCVCCLFWTNRNSIGVTSIFVSISSSKMEIFTYIPHLDNVFFFTKQYCYFNKTYNKFLWMKPRGSNCWKYWIHFFRLTGVYAFVVLFHMTLLRGFSGGPNDFIPSLINLCRSSWWRNLLYLTNYDLKLDYVENTGAVKNFFHLKFVV